VVRKVRLRRRQRGRHQRIGFLVVCWPRVDAY
jgi:hypothetical protein